MQAVEIAKALADQAEVMIMDEPTSALSAREVEALFRTIDDLRQRGMAIIYISHKLTEVFQLADRVTVLRDGSHVGTYSTGELTPDRLIALMVGRELNQLLPRAAVAPGAPLLAVRALGKTGRFRDITFQVGRGEVV